MDRIHRSNEVLLDFSSIFWGFIDQWKAILLFSLIISLLITGLKYRYDTSQYNAAIAASKDAAITAEQAEQRINETLNALSAEDRSAVDFALGFNSLIKDKYKYQSESPIMSIDPNHTEILSITFRINGDVDASARTSLSDGYITTFYDESVLQNISEATETDIAPVYLKELLSFSDPYEKLSYTPDSIINDDDTFNVFVIIPVGESADSFRNAITDAIYNRAKDLSKSIAPHTVEAVTASSSVTVCNSILAKQSDIYYSSSYLKTSLNAVTAEFSPQQAAAYNTVIHLQSIANGTEATPTDAAATAPSKPGISFKATVLGFISGIILYLFVFIVRMLFNERILSSGLAKKITHKRLLGECYQDVERSTLFEKLMHSNAVFNLRYKGKTDPDNQAEEIAHVLNAISSREHIDDISIINTSERQDSIAELIKSKAERPISVLHNANISDDSLKGVSDVVLSISNNTQIKQLYSLADLLDYYRINILGFIYSADR